VVTEFLKFARPQELANEEVAVGQIIERVTSELRDSLPQAEIVSEGQFECISGDEGLLRQAVLNLVRNAAEAAGERSSGAQVIVRGAVEQTGGRTVQRLSVADNGPGIPPPTSPRFSRPSSPPNRTVPAWAWPSCRKSSSSTAARLTLGTGRKGARSLRFVYQ
jgi:signal transduction histidine kinase